jgi:multicomponent Na+:H+ antiporter subunit A
LVYHLDARPQNLLALATYALGVLVVVARPLWTGAACVVSRMGERLGPERGYARGLDGLNAVSNWLYRAEVRNLQTSVAGVLVPALVLLAAGLLATPTEDAYRVGPLTVGDLPLLLTLLLVTVAAVTTMLPRGHLTLVLALSAVGYSLAVAYGFFGAPDVALVAVLVETVLTLLFVGILALFPSEVLRRASRLDRDRAPRWRDPLLAVVAGVFAFGVVWSILSQPARDTVASQHVALAPSAHAQDVVTAILADFRGLDTAGEVTVIGIALLGVANLLRRGQLS